MLFFTLFLAACSAIQIKGVEMHYAVLTVGSCGYSNYRHQADVCHAYHVLRNGGMPAENIVVLSCDDAARSFSNPIRGKLFNAPTGPDGGDAVDVYEGCEIDYTGKEVSQATFIAVLTGDTDSVQNKGTGRVLKSTQNDNVFINFVDHGGVDIIVVGNNQMHSKVLLNALNTMHEQNMYNQLVFYLETCESGSMFENLADDISVYALTAANAKESSWGTYCSPYDVVTYNGKQKKMDTCLGDLFSVTWLQETDSSRVSNDAAALTLKKQYKFVKKHTNKSHVMEYGDFSYQTDAVEDFEGNENERTRVRSKSNQNSTLSIDVELLNRSAVDSREISLHNKYAAYKDAQTEEEKQQALTILGDEISLRAYFEEFFTTFSSKLSNKNYDSVQTPTDVDCYMNSVEYFVEACKIDLNEQSFAMKYYRNLRQGCADSTMADKENFIKTNIATLCKNIS